MRPEIEWSLPGSVRAGGSLRVGLALVREGGTRVDAVTLRLLCEQASADATTESHAQRVELQRGDARLPDRAEFEAGFAIPDDAPASSALRGVSWWLELHVSIPWWPDLHARKPVTVRAAKTAEAAPDEAEGEHAPEEAPREPEAPRFEAPRPTRAPVERTVDLEEGARAELAVEDDHFAPGDRVRGQVALAGTAGRDLYLLELQIGRSVTVDTGDGTMVIWERHAPLLERSAGLVEGVVLPFEGRLPIGTKPGDDFQLRVRLEHGTASGYAFVPIRVGLWAPHDAPLSALPLVGSVRWRAVWEEVAAAEGVSLDERALALHGEVEEASFDVAFEAGGLRVVVRWPDLDLGLRLEPRGLSLSGPSIGSSAFRRAFRVAGRDPRQCEAFLAGAPIAALEEYDLEACDDAHAVVSADASFGRKAPALTRLVRSIRGLATAFLEAARAMPPPTHQERAARLWRAFAEDHGGDFSMARLAVAGLRRDEGVASLEALYDDGRVQGCALRLSTERGLAGEIPAEMRRALAPGVIAIEGRALVVTYAEIVEEASKLAPALATLDALAAQLAGGGQGPYR